MAHKEEISNTPVGVEQKATNNTENIFKICPVEILG